MSDSDSVVSVGPWGTWSTDLVITTRSVKQFGGQPSSVTVYNASLCYIPWAEVSVTSHGGGDMSHGGISVTSHGGGDMSHGGDKCHVTWWG